MDGTRKTTSNLAKKNDTTGLNIIWNSKLIEKYDDEILTNTRHILPSPYIRLQGQDSVGLRRPGIKFEHTIDERNEIIRCANDLCYFTEKYCKTMTDAGIQNIILRPYQKKILKQLQENRFVVWVAPRQCGKTVTSAFFMCWYLCFHYERNILTVANKETTAFEIMDKVEIVYRHLPYFIKPGLTVNNVGRLEFDSGNRMIGNPTTSKPGLGFTIHLLYCDEFAHVHNNISGAFWRSAYPTLSSSDISRFIVTSTFNGKNKFWSVYNDAVKGRNEFFPIRIDWWEIPGRDEEWRRREIANMGLEGFNQEYGNMPIAESNILLSTKCLQRMNQRTTKYVWREFSALEKAGVDYEDLKWHPGFEFDELDDPNSKFVLSIDTAEGIGKDYTVINIFKVIPYSIKEIEKMTKYKDESSFFRLSQIGLYRNNKVGIQDFAQIVYKLIYNVFNTDSCTLIIEINRTEGILIIDKLQKNGDYYDNILLHTKHNQEGNLKPGVRLNAQVKMLYIREFKSLIESERIILSESNTIKECESFGIKKNSRYGALYGHDDAVMSSVNTVPFFTSDQFYEFVGSLYDNLDYNLKTIINEKLNNVDIEDNEDTDYTILRDMM